MSLVQTFFLGTLLGLTGIQQVFAQSSDATCTLGSFRWAFNSREQSPCEVASSLVAVCTGSYNVEALEPNSHYIGPTIDSANECQCSSVTYSMMSACGACQNRTMASWSEWTGSCPKVSHRSFSRPLPERILVPGWAYFDVKEHDAFDILLAKENANATESSFIPPPPSTSSSTQASPTPVAGSTPDETPESKERREDRLRGIIGQSVVGGVLFMFLATCGILAFVHHRRQPKSSAVQNADPAIDSNASQKSADTESQMEERSVPILLIHPPTTAQLNAIAVAGSSSSSDRSLSPTSARGRGYDSPR